MAFLDLVETGLKEEYLNRPFEIVALRDGRAIFLENHINRMNKTLKYLKEEEIEFHFFKNQVLEFLKEHKRKENTFTLVATESGIKIFFENIEIESRGLNVKTIVMNDFVIDEDCKHSIFRNRKREKLLEEVQSLGFDDALLFNNKNKLVSGINSTVFCIKGNVIYTPGLFNGALSGVNRSVFRNLLTIKESDISLRKVRGSQVIFLLDSSRGIRFVDMVNGKDLKPHQEMKKYIQNMYDRVINEYLEY